jgi:hypothetical protein
MKTKPQTLRDEIVALLSQHSAPLTSAEIAHRMGNSYASVRRAIAAARKGKNKLFYIADYDEVAGDGYKRPAMYAVGRRPDMPYPHVGMAQKYKRHWEREKLKRKIASAGASNPFATLIAQVTS